MMLMMAMMMMVMMMLMMMICFVWPRGFDHLLPRPSGSSIRERATSLVLVMLWELEWLMSDDWINSIFVCMVVACKC